MNNIAGLSTQRGLRDEVESLRAENELLAESYAGMARAALEFDEVGWRPLNSLGDEGVTLVEAQRTAETIRRQMNTNGLLKRGANLRASYVFGRMFKMANNNKPLASRFQAIIDDPINQAVLFGEKACKRNEKTLFSEGNFFVKFDRARSRFATVPFNEIQGVAVDPEDPNIIMYVLREFTRPKAPGSLETVTVSEWYPMDHVSGVLQSRINGKPVNQSNVLFDMRVNDDTGGLWGLPDGLAAAPWAWSYNEFAKDGAKLLKALSSIAWQVKSKSSAGGRNAAAKIAQNRGAAQTVVSGADVELNAMPRNNSVDLATGQPLAALAASAMEVSVEALLGNGSDVVMDQPTLNAAYGRQGDWEAFFVRVLKVIGVQNPSVKFNKIIVDPSYRSVQSLGQGWQTGLFAADVIQAAYAEELGIEAPGAIPDGVLLPNNALSVASQSTGGANTTPGADITGGVEVGAMTNVATSQGNSGAGVGDLTNSDNTLRDIQNLPR